MKGSGRLFAEWSNSRNILEDLDQCCNQPPIELWKQAIQMIGSAHQLQTKHWAQSGVTSLWWLFMSKPDNWHLYSSLPVIIIIGFVAQHLKHIRFCRLCWRWVIARSAVAWKPERNLKKKHSTKQKAKKEEEKTPQSFALRGKKCETLVCRLSGFLVASQWNTAETDQNWTFIMQMKTSGDGRNVRAQVKRLAGNLDEADRRSGVFPHFLSVQQPQSQKVHGSYHTWTKVTVCTAIQRNLLQQTLKGCLECVQTMILFL